MEDISLIDRFKELPSFGSMTDLCWSDPTDKLDKWGKSPRGSGYIFGKDIATEFTRRNGL